MEDTEEEMISRQLLLDEIRLNRRAIRDIAMRERQYVTWTNLFSVLTLVGLAVGTIVAMVP